MSHGESAGEMLDADADEFEGPEAVEDFEESEGLEDAEDLEDDGDDLDTEDLEDEDEDEDLDDGEEDDADEAEDELAGSDESDGESRKHSDRGTATTLAELEQEGEIAADYVEGLLDIADLDGDIDMDVEGDRALVSVVGGTLDDLIGSKGEVLEALQELTRLAVQRQTGLRTRMMLDVGGYRAHRREELTDFGTDAADEVKQTGTPKRLAPMTAFERKIVHDAVAAAGLRSESEGEDPDRRVVVYPAE
jgi:spoIIIJ-associated protein